MIKRIDCSGVLQLRVADSSPAWHPAVMAPKLTDEQRQALESRPGEPVEVEDDRSQRIYILVARDDFRHLLDEQLRRQLQIGFDQADQGDVEDWDVDEMLSEARRRRDSQTAH
jgi:bifunctional DNA-binding transcriptional regulator/antitoxin component of YhaV-PrlF toxin-antitoxin module